jgi:hypothetical protein
LDSNAITFPQFIGGVTARVEQEPDLTVAGRGKFKAGERIPRLATHRYCAGLSLLPRVFVAIQNEPSRNDGETLHDLGR